MAGKADFVNSIADSVEGISRKQAAEAFEAVFDAITDAPARRATRAKVPGFGSFSVSRARGAQGPQPRDRRVDHHQGEQERPLQGRQGAQGRGQRRSAAASKPLDRAALARETRSPAAPRRRGAFVVAGTSAGSADLPYSRARRCGETPQKKSSQISQLVATVRTTPRSTKRRAEVVTGARRAPTPPGAPQAAGEVEVLEDRPVAEAAEALEGLAGHELRLVAQRQRGRAACAG